MEMHQFGIQFTDACDRPALADLPAVIVKTVSPCHVFLDTGELHWLPNQMSYDSAGYGNGYADTTYLRLSRSNRGLVVFDKYGDAERHIQAAFMAAKAFLVGQGFNPEQVTIGPCKWKL